MSDKCLSDEEFLDLASKEFSQAQPNMEGVRQGFAAVADRITDRCLLRCKRDRLPDSDAEDIAQKVCIGVWQGVIKNRGEVQSVPAFTMKILGRRLADYFAKRKGKEGRKADILSSAEGLYGTDGKPREDIEADSPGPVEQVMDREDTERLLSAVNEIDAEDREVLQAVLMGGTMNEIAQSLGIELGAARYRLDRALRRLSQKLKNSR